jgi:hypothetical protein
VKILTKSNPNKITQTVLILQIIDIGEDLAVPDDFSEQDMISGMWWRHLVAGGVAGAVSRTCTAPLDRIKIFLQVKLSTTPKAGLKNGGRGYRNSIISL